MFKCKCGYIWLWNEEFNMFEFEEQVLTEEEFYQYWKRG